MNSSPNSKISAQCERADRKSQRARILRVLIDASGSWVPLPEILALGVAQYNARIFELRRLGFDIKNRVEVDAETGVRHSWFRLVASRTIETPKPDPLTDWKDRPRVTGLPLFDAGVRP